LYWSRPYSRLPLASLRARPEQDLGGALAGGRAFALSLARARRCCGTESRCLGRHSEAAQKIAARAQHRRDEFGSRRRNARDRFFSATRPLDAGIAIRLWHPEF